MNIHVVRSVKGGSGKTCFALHKSVYLSVSEKEKKKVLYIDADVHASETMSVMMHNTLITPGEKKCEAPDKEKIKPDAYTCVRFDNDYANFIKETNLPHTLNSYMHPYRGYISTFNDIIIEGELYDVRIDANDGKSFYVKVEKNGNPEVENSIPSLDFIFADPTNKGRAVFENMYQSSGTSAIGLGLYVAKMKTLLRLAASHEYKDIVIDMPPGSDTFSSHLMDCATDFVSEKDSTHRLHVYYVAGSDKSHIRSSAKAAIEQHLHLMRKSTPCEVSFVFNEVNNDADNMECDTRKQVIDNIYNRIHDEYTDAMCELNRLSYYTIGRDDSYYHHVRGEDNLAVLFKAHNEESPLIKEL